MLLRWLERVREGVCSGGFCAYAVRARRRGTSPSEVGISVSLEMEGKN